MSDSEKIIRIWLNGEAHQFPATATVMTLLERFGLTDKPLAVEQNGIALLPEAFSTTHLTENDRLEMIVIAAGG